MLAAYAAQIDSDDPLSGLRVEDRPEPESPEGWTTVEVRAAALNHHDLWSLRGVGLPEDRLPMILGCDAAGVDEEGNEVIVHAVIASDGWCGDETLDPKRTLLSELHQGTLAERVAVPQRNLVPKPEALSFAEAACLPTAWLTAYRMLFTRLSCSRGRPCWSRGHRRGVHRGDPAGRHAGLRVWVTCRDEAKRERASSSALTPPSSAASGCPSGWTRPRDGGRGDLDAHPALTRSGGTPSCRAAPA